MMGSTNSYPMVRPILHSITIESGTDEIYRTIMQDIEGYMNRWFAEFFV